MHKISLAGEWKLRGEFMDVTADRFTEVLRKLDADPVAPTLPGFLTLEDLPEEARNTRAAIWSACPPEIRITLMEPSPAGVATAAIVSAIKTSCVVSKPAMRDLPAVFGTDSPKRFLFYAGRAPRPLPCILIKQ